MSENIIKREKLSLKTQTIAALLAIVGAVAVPQIFHVIGLVSGTGTALGEIFLPMHLPIILVGLMAGPYAGAVSGLLGPLASSLMTGMPSSAMLPFMMLELCGYGLAAGLLKNAKMPSLAKILIAQLGGRAVRAVAILIAVYALGNENVMVASIWNSVIKGLPGLVLQWTFLPLLMYRISAKEK